MSQVTRIILLFSMLLFAACATGRSTFVEGQRLEQQGRLDEAVKRYTQAATENPESKEIRTRLLKAREEAAQLHFRKGQEALRLRNLEEAVTELETAYGLNPALDRAQEYAAQASRLRDARTMAREGQEHEKNRRLKEAFRTYRQALSLDANNHEAKEGIERLTQRKKNKLDAYDLNLKSTKPITLKFKEARLKDVFNILTQLSGINFIFDEAVKDNLVTVYLENASFQQAMEVITSMNKLGKKVLNESTMVIYPRTPEKAKQYEELVVKTYYLNSLDAKKAVNLLRTMLQVKKIYVNEELNALVIRDTPEVTEVAQKILEANDLPEAEVILEVEVVEISKKNAENFGLALSRYALSAGAAREGSSSLLLDTLPSQIAQTTSGNGSQTVTTTANNLLTLFKWNSFNAFLTIPTATYNFGKSLANAEVLSNPRLRVRNREKSKFNVGTRVPITTTSSNGTAGGVNVNVQYVDVGVKVNAEPTIQANNEISIKMSLEVSSILQKEAVGSDKNTTVVTIGSRNLDTVLTLKDGETSIIGGLIQDSNSKSKDKIFLLGDVPVLGSLLSNNNNANDKSELVLSLTPRVIRSVAIPDEEISTFWSGRDDEPSVTNPYTLFGQEPEFLPDAPAKQEAKGAGQKPAAAPQPQVQAPRQSAPQPPATPDAGEDEDESSAAAPEDAAAPAPVASAPPAPVAPVAPVAAQQAQPQAPKAAPPVAPPAAAAAPVMPAPMGPGPVPPPGRGTLQFNAPQSVREGDQFTVNVVATAPSLAKAPFILIFDPLFADFVTLVEGDFMKKGSPSLTFNAKPEKERGRIVVNLERAPGTGGASGTGTLVTAIFKAKAAGPFNLGFQNVGFSGPAGEAVEVVPYNTVVDIAPKSSK